MRIPSFDIYIFFLVNYKYSPCLDKHYISVSDQ